MMKRDKPGQSSVSKIAARLKEVASIMSPLRGAARVKPGSYGAIKADVPVGLIHGPNPEFAMLFDNDALEIALRRFEDLGLSELLDSSHLASMGRNQISQQTAHALNAKKCDIQGFDPAENEAWFLAAFASLWLDTGLADPAMAEPIRADESGRPLDLARALDLRRCLALIEFGRLLEWWRWRRKGHDADAIRGEDFNPKRPRRKTGRSPNKRKINRDKNIVKRARVLLQMGEGRCASSGRINISNLAGLVITSLKPDIKKTRVKEIIREAIRDRKLTD